MSNRKLSMKILIRLPDGKQQQFTMESKVENPDIHLGTIAYTIERAINENTPYRAHADIEEA